MKKIICSLILLCSWSLYAQDADDYRPFIEEGKEWLLIGDYLGEDHGKSKVSIWRNYITGDTVISGHLCKKWFQQDSQYNVKREIETLAVYAYEEDKKVWFFHEGMTTPGLLFDFGAEVGDTLHLLNVDAFVYRNIHQTEPQLINIYMSDTVVIKKKDTGKVGDLVENRIWFTSAHTSYYSKDLDGYNYLMEGVGLWARPNWNTLIYPGMKGSLICCHVDEKVLYFDSTLAAIADIPIPTSIRSLQTVNGRSAQKDASHLKKSVNDQCYDLTGRPLAAPPSKGIYLDNGRKKVVSKER